MTIYLENIFIKNTLFYMNYGKLSVPWQSSFYLRQIRKNIIYFSHFCVSNPVLGSNRYHSTINTERIISGQYLKEKTTKTGRKGLPKIREASALRTPKKVLEAQKEPIWECEHNKEEVNESGAQKTWETSFYILHKKETQGWKPTPDLEDTVHCVPETVSKTTEIFMK